VNAETPQLQLPLGSVRSKELFSSHWLQHRLRLEPEWNALRPAAQAALDRIATLWAVQRTRVAQYGAEHPLEEAFIQPILREIGWILAYQTHLRGREPDYALFATDALLDRALAAGRVSPDFWTHPTLVADSKAWHVNLDRPVSINDRREYPPEQIEWYLDRSRLSFGILTNGRLWRLVPRELEPDQPRFQTYLEVDLETMLEAWRTEANWIRRDQILDDFFQFFLFFGPNGHIETELPALVVRARRGSSEYRLSVGEDLKDRVFEALRLCIDGFLDFDPNQLTADSLTECRAESFVFLYRLLFILYAEDRQLLPYKRNRLYTANRSLGRRRHELATALDRVRRRNAQDFSRTSTALWDDLLELFDLIDEGHRRYEVPAYNGGLFADEQHPFLREKRLPDWYLARVIDQLSRTTDPEQEDEVGLFAVDYRDLRIQHLGSIYERLLELHPEVAQQPTLNELTGDEIPVGHVFLKTERGERRATGSYYTPDQITDYLVAETLGPLCREITTTLRGEIGILESRMATASDPVMAELQSQLTRLNGDFDDRVLRLRVLDPAMGSGHFLLSACKFLAEEIATNPLTRDPDSDRLVGDESALTYWKRRVVEHCLYGVDQNPLAVELAKLALWLETVSGNHPLTFLDHHIKAGDSLVGATIDELRHLPGSGALLRTSFAAQVAGQLPSFLEPLREIAQIPSDTTDQVKEKERLLRLFSERLQPFMRVADLWCACFYLEAEAQPTEGQYEQAIAEMSHPVRLARLAEEAWFRRALSVAESTGPFCHWELEFPGVFFSAGVRRPDAGFDAVIGNPPYDVLSALETGRNLDGLRAFIDYGEQYRPSIRGKNNLYKLFICRATQFLAINGRFGFIVPMPFLGDDQAFGIRQMLFSSGRFTGIEAFPQKDDASRRVFPEAKLSTTAFAFHKTDDAALRRTRFAIRTHQAQWIEGDSPRLSLATSEIPLYDPDNLAIASCSQEDWDLAVRIMESGRMARLGTMCVSYQGEVNETNESKPNRNAISRDSADGPLVLRGSNLTLYMIREASQGEPLYLRLDAFLAGKAADSKAFHHRTRRVGFQRSSPQNNFRRIVAAPIEAGQFCFDTVSYIPESESRLSLHELLALLNSQLLDWYFRLGSTNSKVNEYQFNNLPVPRFAEVDADARAVARGVLGRMDAGDFEGAFVRLQTHLVTPPFSGAVRLSLAALVERIIDSESRRGPITRRERANLSVSAQPFQDLVDRILFAAAGITDREGASLTQRLAQML
jgi:hypothetical protein